MSEETIEVNPCALCGGRHIYLLDVKRSSFMFGRSSSDSSNVKFKRIERLFPCPSKGDFYQTVVELKEDGNQKIEEIRVVGIVEEKSNGQA